MKDKAAAEIKRVEDKRTMSEVFWKAEVERFKREVQLPYALSDGNFGTEKEEKEGRSWRIGEGRGEMETEIDLRQNIQEGQSSP